MLKSRKDVGSKKRNKMRVNPTKTKPEPVTHQPTTAPPHFTAEKRYNVVQSVVAGAGVVAHSKMLL